MTERPPGASRLRETPGSQHTHGPLSPGAVASGAHSYLAGLQGTIGNRQVATLLGAQARLEVGRAHDPFEAEAERVSAQVVERLRSGGGVEPRATETAALGLARTIRRRQDPAVDPVGPEGGMVDPAVERSLASSRGGGSRLEPGVRRDMEGAFGADFGHVRLHAGQGPSELNRALGAQAFTLGPDIFFAGSVPDTSQSDGQALLAHELTHTVQQGVAAPVQRVIRRAPGDALASGDQEGKEEEEEGQVSGTIPDSLIPQVAGMGWGPPSGIISDASSAPSESRSARRPSGGAASMPSSAGTHALSVDNINVVSDTVEAPMIAGRSDDGLRASPNVKWSAQPGLGVNPFGEMQPNHDFTNMDFTVKSSKKANTINLTFDVDVLCKWGTAPGTCNDIASGTSAIITADNYADIAADLTVKKVEKSWVAPRQDYYSKALVERHEKYHATDEQKWVKSQGKTRLANYLKSKTVALTDTQRKDPAQVRSALAPVMADALVSLKNGSDTYYMGGASYYSRPGEERAFGDGKGPYQRLVADVKKQGKKLAAEKKKADKALAKASTATTTTTGSTPTAGATAGASGATAPVS